MRLFRFRHERIHELVKLSPFFSYVLAVGVMLFFLACSDDTDPRKPTCCRLVLLRQFRSHTGIRYLWYVQRYSKVSYIQLRISLPRNHEKLETGSWRLKIGN